MGPWALLQHSSWTQTVACPPCAVQASPVSRAGAWLSPNSPGTLLSKVCEVTVTHLNQQDMVAAATALSWQLLVLLLQLCKPWRALVTTLLSQLGLGGCSTVLILEKVAES